MRSREAWAIHLRTGNSIMRAFGTSHRTTMTTCNTVSKRLYVFAHNNLRLILALQTGLSLICAFICGRVLICWSVAGSSRPHHIAVDCCNSLCVKCGGRSNKWRFTISVKKTFRCIGNWDFRLLQRITLTCGRGARVSIQDSLLPRASTVHNNK